MIGSHPPHALPPTTFRFPALAALAGRASLGGQREVVLAAYVAARLAHDTLPERRLPSSARSERVGAAKMWLSSLTLPPAIRPEIVKAVEASSGPPNRAADAIRAVLSATTGMLDARARQELVQLASALDAGA